MSEVQAWQRFSVSCTTVTELEEAQAKRLFAEFQSLLAANRLTVVTFQQTPVSGHRATSMHGRSESSSDGK